MKILLTASILLGFAFLLSCAPDQTIRGGTAPVRPLYEMAAPTGLRVQIFAAVTREGADRIAARARTNFTEQVSVDYIYPYYKVRIGNCADRACAEALRQKAVQTGYHDAFVVSSQINQNYAYAPTSAYPPETVTYRSVSETYASVPKTHTAAPPNERPAVLSNSGIGYATWYGSECDGRRTASGEVYDMHGLTAASRTLSFGTKVRITNLENKKSVVVRINDRGPAPRKYCIDLSYGAAEEIGSIERGVVKVRLDILR